MGRTAGEHSRLISKGVTDVAIFVFEKDRLAEQGREEEPAVSRDNGPGELSREACQRQGDGGPWGWTQGDAIKGDERCAQGW